MISKTENEKQKQINGKQSYTLWAKQKIPNRHKENFKTKHESNCFLCHLTWCLCLCVLFLFLKIKIILPSERVHSFLQEVWVRRNRWKWNLHKTLYWLASPRGWCCLHFGGYVDGDFDTINRKCSLWKCIGVYARDRISWIYVELMWLSIIVYKMKYKNMPNWSGIIRRDNVTSIESSQSIYMLTIIVRFKATFVIAWLESNKRRMQNIASVAQKAFCP